MDICHARTAIESFLSSYLPTEHGVPESIRYAVLGGGKRWRPLVCLATAEAYGVPLDRAMPIATAHELAHAATLLIDDLPSFDDELIRRGKQTTHARYGEATAVLGVPLLMDMALELIVNTTSGDLQTNILRERIATTKKLVAGQYHDVMQIGLHTLDQVLYGMHQGKTGALFGCATASGALLGGASDPALKFIRAYATYAGIAYQVADDIIDVTARAEDIGKSVGKDRGKVTSITFGGIDGARSIKRELDARADRFIEQVPHDMSALRIVIADMRKEQYKLVGC